MVLDRFNVIVLFLNLLNILILHNAYISISDKNRKTDIERIVAFSAYFLCMGIVQLCIKSLIISLSVQLVTILWVALTYKEKLKDNIISAVVLSCLLSIPDYVASKIIRSKPVLLSIIIASRMLILAGSLLLYGFRKKNLGSNLNEHSILFMTAIPVCSLIMQGFILIDNGISYSITCGTILIILINIIAYCLYESLATHYVRNANIAILQRENELYSRQCEIMRESTEELQAFRHDLNNQLIAMNELLAANQVEAAKKQLHSLAVQTEPRIIYSYTGNTPIDSIINYKFQNAEKEHIKINTQIAVPSDIKIEVVDIITILGNLLDNAIEAVLLLKDNRLITLKLVYSQDRLIIRVTNSFNGIVKSMNGSIITTKADTANHGFGLANVQKIAEKYNGILKTGSSGGIFTVDVLLFIISQNQN